MNVPKKEKISSNKSFGLLFFLLFAIWAFWSFRGELDQIKFLPLCFSLVFLVLGLLNSNLLTPLNRLWHYLGILLGNIVAPIVMGTIFFLVVTPTGLIMRLFGKDTLRLKKNKKINSYWINKEKIKSKMKNQF
tara:strand:- start:501 stop:899 length:399 start_codon:yes stop_codon:yes gene_type:complete